MYDNPNRIYSQRGNDQLSMWDIRDFEKKFLQLKKQYREKDGKLKGLMTIFDGLRSDFAYNLDLIRKRDAELAEFDKSVNWYKTLLNKKDIENSKQGETIDRLKNITNDLRTKISELENEVRKSKLETKREREEGEKRQKAKQKKFADEIKAAHCATAAAEHQAEKYKQRIIEVTKALEGKLDKSEKRRIKAELDHKTLQQEKQDVESKYQSATVKIKTLHNKLKMKSSKASRLEQDNMEKSTTVLWLRKRVQSVQEEAVTAYETKVKNLVEQLTLLQKQTTQQQSIFREQVSSLEHKLLKQEEKHRGELEIVLKKKTRLEYLETELQQKSSIVEGQVQKAKEKLIEQDNALLTLNFDLNRALKRGEALSSELAEERTKFKGKLEEADERIEKLAEERAKLRGKNEHYRKLAEEKALEEQLKASGIVKKISLDRDAHFQELVRCRRELQNTRSKLQEKKGQECKLEEKNSKLQQVITQMRIETELTRKQLENDIDRKRDRILKYKQKDSHMKRSLVELAMEKNLAVLRSGFRTSELNGELSKATETLNRLSDEREQLVDINKYLRADVERGTQINRPSLLQMNPSRPSFALGDFPSKKRVSTKRSKLRKKLDEIKVELDKQTGVRR